ncbi:MAG: hypothetical protein ACPL7K_00880 [Armatimonadota bacterium]
MAVQELAGSPRYVTRYEAVGPMRAVVREFVCDWDEVQSVIRNALRTGATDQDGIRLSVSHVSVVPYSEGNSVCYPTGVDSEGKAKYDKARVTITYSTVVIEDDAGGYFFGFSESIDIGYDTIQYPMDGFYYATGGSLRVPVEQQYKTIRVPILEYSVTVKRFGPAPPAVLSLVGFVNSAPLFTKNLGVYFNPGCVLYAGLEFHHTTVPAAVTPNVYTCRFLVHPFEGWDRLPSAQLGGWYYPSVDGVTPLLTYPRANLNAVLM